MEYYSGDVLSFNADNNTIEYYTDYYDYGENTTLTSTHTNLNKWVPPLLILIGVIGNVLTLLILRRPLFRYSPTNLYLSSLAVGDILVLSTGLLRYWLINTLDFDLRLQSNIICKLHVFMVYWSFQFVAWITVAVAVDRLLTVCVIVQAKLFCTRRNAIYITAAIGGVLLLLNINLIVSMEITKTNVPDRLDPILYCTNPTQYAFFYDHVWPWIDSIIASFLPCIIILSCNISIVCVLLYKKRYSSTTHSKVSTLTAILLLICLLFFITTVPFAIFQTPTINKYFKENSTQLSHTEKLNFVFNILYLVTCVNNSVNFLIYCACGERFRYELCRLFARPVVRVRPVPIVNVIVMRKL